MVNIIFELHGTTTDNEKHLASGWNDVELSELGVKESKEMGERNGESYEQTSERMRSFLEDLVKNYDGKRVMIVGHRATQYGLEYLINKIPLEQIIPAPWKWQPGWEYKLEKI